MPCIQPLDTIKTSRGGEATTSTREENILRRGTNSDNSQESKSRAKTTTIRASSLDTDILTLTFNMSYNYKDDRLDAKKDILSTEKSSSAYLLYTIVKYGLKCSLEKEVPQSKGAVSLFVQFPKIQGFFAFLADQRCA